MKKAQSRAMHEAGEVVDQACADLKRLKLPRLPDLPDPVEGGDVPSRHTALPWIQDTGCDCKIYGARVRWSRIAHRDEPPLVAACAGETTAEGFANAALIVRAVNAHAVLLEALRAIILECDAGTHDAGTRGMIKGRAALEAAEGKETRP